MQARQASLVLQPLTAMTGRTERSDDQRPAGEPAGAVKLGEYSRFLASAILLAAGVGAVGYLPTLRLAGPAAIPALLMGLVVAVAASAVGGVAIALAGTEPIRRPQAILLATVLRLLTAVGLGLGAVASGRFASRPLGVWIAIGYVTQLAIDSRYAMRAPVVTPGGGRSGGNEAPR